MQWIGQTVESHNELHQVFIISYKWYIFSDILNMQIFKTKLGPKLSLSWRYGINLGRPPIGATGHESSTKTILKGTLNITIFQGMRTCVVDIPEEENVNRPSQS